MAAITKAEAGARAQAAMECLNMDAAETLSAMARAVDGIARLSSALECVALDWAENGVPFDDEDVRA